MESESQANPVVAPLYDNDSQQPAADAPLRDLPPDVRPVFKTLRALCQGIPRVIENVRHEGTVWKWIWAYERDGYTLCVIHPMRTSVDLSFPLPQRYEPSYEKSELDKSILAAASKGPTAAKIRYVRVNVPDNDSATRLFQGVQLKLRLMAEEGKGD